MTDKKILPLVVFGTGATSRESEIIIKRINNVGKRFEFLGFVSGESNNPKVITLDNEFENFCRNYYEIGAVIPIANGKIKESIYHKIKNIKNIVFPNIIDPGAVFIDIETTKIGIGNVIEYGAVININTKIGSFNLININSIIGHDSVVGDYCAVNPGAIISGNVKIKNNVTIGAGAVIKQNLSIGENSVLGLGAFAVDDIEKNTTIVCPKGQKLIKGD